jgi:hypothetical protein
MKASSRRIPNVLTRRHVVAGAVAILVAFGAGIAWFRIPAESSLDVVGLDPPDAVIFALTNRIGTLADYSHEVEVKVDDAWMPWKYLPGMMWQNPPFREKQGIDHAGGVHFCVPPPHEKTLPPGCNAWRLRVTLTPLPLPWNPTYLEKQRFALARRLQRNLPRIAGWVRPKGFRPETLYGPPMRGPRVVSD